MEITQPPRSSSSVSRPAALSHCEDERQAPEAAGVESVSAGQETATGSEA